MLTVVYIRRLVPAVSRTVDRRRDTGIPTLFDPTTLVHALTIAPGLSATVYEVRCRPISTPERKHITIHHQFPGI